jgi:two-component system, sensor histidine kinase
MKCNPSRWVWGLIPIAMLSWATFHRERPNVEADLTERAQAALVAAGQSWAKVSVIGREAVITGRAKKDGEPKAALAYGLAALNVVVIDNDAAVRDAMRALLERWGCNARLLSGLAAVEKLIADEPSFYPDIILADFHLDNGDCGLSAVAALRAGRSAAIPAVVITADHSSDVAGKVDAAGCEILRKPVKPAELRALVTHLVR